MPSFGSFLGGAALPIILPKTIFVSATTGIGFSNWFLGIGGLAALPAGSTGNFLVIPVSGLNVGDTVQAIRVLGQVESAGNIVTLSMAISLLTATAADVVATSLGSVASGNLTADTLLSGSALEVAGIDHVLTSLEGVSVLLTGTAAALTDIAIAGIQIDVLRG